MEISFLIKCVEKAVKTNGINKPVTWGELLKVVRAADYDNNNEKNRIYNIDPHE